MKIVVDQILKQKLIAVVDEKRAFSLEFPSDSNNAELYGVISSIKEELWKAMEAQKKLEQEKSEVKEEIPVEAEIVEATLSE
jgi:hypothetical protein